METKKQPPRREAVLTTLRAHKATLKQRFGILEMTLYGSVARDDATADSDIDIMARFDESLSWDRFFDAQFYIEDLFDRRIDLATHRELRPEILPYVERDAIHV